MTEIKTQSVPIRYTLKPKYVVPACSHWTQMLRIERPSICSKKSTIIFYGTKHLLQQFCLVEARLESPRCLVTINEMFCLLANESFQVGDRMKIMIKPRRLFGICEQMTAVFKIFKTISRLICHRFEAPSVLSCLRFHVFVN